MMRSAAQTSLVASSLAGCVQWQHAPGHDQRQHMVEAEIRVVTGRFCHFGACDRTGPAGRFDFENVHYFAFGDQRTETSFDIAYAGARARCAQRDEPDRAFACTLTEGTGVTYELTLAQGCTKGAVFVVGSSVPAWMIETDVVTIAGIRTPGDELAVFDANGLLAFSHAFTSDNANVFTRSGATLSRAHLLTIVSVHAFLQLDHLPRACRGRA